MLKQLNPTNKKGYENYRWFFTSEDVLVVGGKSDDQNEAALKKFLKPNYLVLHTSKPGSPFMIIQSDNPSEKDIKEAAVFTACFSQQWKNGKTADKISIDIFRGNQIYKTRSMKLGTFGIKEKKEIIKVKPELVLIIQKGKLRAVPKTKRKEQILIELKPGKLSKEQTTEKIFDKIRNQFNFPITKQEISSAIPSDRLEVK